MSDLRRLLHRTADHAADYLETVDDRPVSTTVTLGELRARLLRPLAPGGEDDETVLDELVRDTDGGLLGSAGGRFFGWVISGSLPAALAADWLTSAWDQNAGLHACSPAEAVIEEACAAHVLDLLGLPADCSVGLVTGCQMAHTTCLAAARNELLARRGVDVERDGLAGAPRLRVLTTRHRHSTLDRSLRLLGLGAGAIEEVDTDAAGRLDVAALDAALGARDEPAIVVLQAGEICTGLFDPFAEAIATAQRHDAWVHVDGAFGLWAAVAPDRRHLIAGFEAADSFATDAHKWLNVPYDSGIAIVRDAAAHRRAMSTQASYLVFAKEARDQADWNPELSRRGRGFALYAALRNLGRDGVADLVERCCVAARDLTRGIGALDGAELVHDPDLNQGLVAFPDPAGRDDRAYTDRVIDEIQRDGEAWFGGADWQGRRVMRISVVGWRTSPIDVDRSVAAVARILGSLRA